MLPDFLCIGAQKAGTTWLYENLRQHPDIWMPPIKELHYFNDTSRLPAVTRLNSPRYRRILRNLIARTLIPGEEPHLRWHLGFLLRRRTDGWYASLFPAGPARVVGEATPGYAKLSSAKIARVKALLPEARIIYILRNPVDRIWSQAAMYFGTTHRKRLDQVERAELLKYVTAKDRIRHSSYLDNLQRWEAHFDSSRILVGFLDQIESRPTDALRALHGFLGVEADQLPKAAHKRHNTRLYPPIPGEVAHELAERLHPQLVALHDRFDNAATARWLAYADSALEG